MSIDHKAQQAAQMLKSRPSVGMPDEVQEELKKLDPRTAQLLMRINPQLLMNAVGLKQKGQKEAFNTLVELAESPKPPEEIGTFGKLRIRMMAGLKQGLLGGAVMGAGTGLLRTLMHLAGYKESAGTKPSEAAEAGSAYNVERRGIADRIGKDAKGDDWDKLSPEDKIKLIDAKVKEKAVDIPNWDKLKPNEKERILKAVPLLQATPTTAIGEQVLMSLGLGALISGGFGAAGSGSAVEQAIAENKLKRQIYAQMHGQGAGGEQGGGSVAYSQPFQPQNTPPVPPREEAQGAGVFGF